MYNRRQVLIAAILASIAPYSQASARKTTPDVVIVGGGAAGLAAAQALLAGGRVPLVLEAAPRLGGRAYTDSSSLGLPFDCGASVVGSDTGQPILAMAKAAGFQTRSYEPSIRIFSNGKPAPEADNEALDAGIEEISERILGAAAEDRAGPASSVLSEGDRANLWLPTAYGVLTAITDGVGMPDRAIADWAALRHGEVGRTLPQGLGTLIQRLAHSLPVEVNTRVIRVVERPDRVDVHTDRGVIRTNAAIVTVSAGVLASGTIAWEPGLPDAIQSAVAGMAMGSLEKVAFSLRASSSILALEPDTFIVTKLDAESSHYILARPHGLPMVIVHFGGSWARDLAKSGASALIAAAGQVLTQAFGNDVLSGRLRVAATQWSVDPNALGAVSVVRPDATHNPRAVLAAPFSNRLALAGEALAHEASQTVAGAYKSGVQSAEMMLRALKKL